MPALLNLDQATAVYGSDRPAGCRHGWRCRHDVVGAGALGLVCSAKGHPQRHPTLQHVRLRLHRQSSRLSTPSTSSIVPSLAGPLPASLASPVVVRNLRVLYGCTTYPPIQRLLRAYPWRRVDPHEVGQEALPPVNNEPNHGPAAGRCNRQRVVSL